MELANLVTAVISIGALLTALIAANRSASSTSVKELRGIIALLKIDVEKSEKRIDDLEKILDLNRIEIRKLEDTLADAEVLQRQYESYIHALILQIKAAGLVPKDIANYVTKRKQEPRVELFVNNKEKIK